MVALRASYSTCVLLLSITLLVFFGLGVALSPEVAFLWPSFSSAQWILAPLGVCGIGGDDCHGALFRKEISAPGNAGHVVTAALRVAASSGYEIRFNGHVLSGAKERIPSRNWKSYDQYNIKDLVQIGNVNTVEVAVWNPTRPPALLVTGSVVFGPGASLPLNTDTTWQVSSLSRTGWLAPERMIPLRDFYPGHLSEFSKHSSGNARVVATLAAYMTLVAAICLYRYGNKTAAPFQAAERESRGIGRAFRHLAENGRFRAAVFVVLFAGLYLPMAAIRDPKDGWDADGHIDYIRYVASGKGLPKAEQGWQMYQPPAYYVFTAAVYRFSNFLSGTWARSVPSSDFWALKTVQMFTPVFALLQILITLRLLALIHPESSPDLLGSSGFALLVPMQIYVSPFISNEVFSSLAITAALFILVSMLWRHRYGPGRSVALGAAVGFACLCKYSGLLVAAATAFSYGVIFLKNASSRRQILRSMAIVALVALILAGPFYLRNLRTYGRPLPQNTEFVRCFTLEYKDLAFFVDPLLFGAGAIDKFVSRTVSFVDGNFSSMWLDNSHKSSAWTRLFEGPTYYLAVFPTFLIALGFCRILRRSREDSQYSRACLPILAYFIVTAFAYAYFILRHGSFETVKAFYGLSLISPLAVFLDAGFRGRAGDCRRPRFFGAAMLLLYGTICAYYLLAPIVIGKGA